MPVSTAVLTASAPAAAPVPRPMAPLPTAWKVSACADTRTLLVASTLAAPAICASTWPSVTLVPMEAAPDSPLAPETPTSNVYRSLRRLASTSRLCV